MSLVALEIVAPPAIAGDRYASRFDCEAWLETGIDSTGTSLRSYARTLLHDCAKGWNYHTYSYRVTGGGYTSKSTSKDYTDSFGSAYTLGGPASSMVNSYHFVRDDDTADPGFTYTLK